MVFQETLTIQTNKAKRILELCKSLGIELYDSHNETSTKKNAQSTKSQINNYLVEYYQWSNLTKGHLENLFLTPRIKIEFDKKDVFGTTFQLNIKSHLDHVLAHQIYFLELIINEMKDYKYINSKEPKESQSVFQNILIGLQKPKISN